MSRRNFVWVALAAVGILTVGGYFISGTSQQGIFSNARMLLPQMWLYSRVMWLSDSHIMFQNTPYPNLANFTVRNIAGGDEHRIKTNLGPNSLGEGVVSPDGGHVIVAGGNVLDTSTGEVTSLENNVSYYMDADNWFWIDSNRVLHHCWSNDKAGKEFAFLYDVRTPQRHAWAYLGKGWQNTASPPNESQKATFMVGNHAVTYKLSPIFEVEDDTNLASWVKVKQTTSQDLDRSTGILAWIEAENVPLAWNEKLKGFMTREMPKPEVDRLYVADIFHGKRRLLGELRIPKENYRMEHVQVMPGGKAVSFEVVDTIYRSAFQVPVNWPGATP